MAAGLVPFKWDHLDNIGDVYTPRTGHAVVNEDGVFYLFGGTDGAARQSDVHAYNVETNLWQEIRAGGRGEEHGLAEAVVWNGAVWFFGGYTKKDFSKCGTSIVLPPCAGLRLGQFLARADTWRGPRAMSETQEALEEWASFGSCAAVMACARTVRWQRALQLLSWSRHGIRARADIPCGIQQFLLAHGLHNGSAQC
ncbi:unnamed protein product [Effrenium voratum]|nr:unnamed protein product [Effrenium voratum]